MANNTQPTRPAPIGNPNPFRNRIPRNAISSGPPNVITEDPPLLELATPYPMHTVLRRSDNTFVPDSQVMFHVLGICDQLMVATTRFTQSCPAWIPIVSQLYISVLWNIHLIKVYADSGYRFFFGTMLDELFSGFRLSECPIPGPLLFFQAVAASKGPYDWVGDICPYFPAFTELWNDNIFGFDETFVRQIPFPTLLLDQLACFAASVPPKGQLSTYNNFHWYDNVFGSEFVNAPRSYLLGPQHCGSLHVSQQQHDAAHEFWSNHLGNFQRLTSFKGAPILHDYRQLFGFMSQDNIPQTKWFSQVSYAMQVYCSYFKDSVSLGSISTTGIGAVATCGYPVNNKETSRWLYPDDADLYSFTSEALDPLRAMPALVVNFVNSTHEFDEEAEQYATLTHTNLNWTHVNRVAGHLDTIDNARIHRGEYWSMLKHRRSQNVSLTNQFQDVISTDYHHLNM